jgi:hypothetical protein
VSSGRLVTVVTPGDDEDDAAALDGTGEPGQTPAAPQSALAGIRRRHQERTARGNEEITTLLVPRSDPPVFVRYAEVTSRSREKVREQLAEREIPEADYEYEAHLLHLVRACRGIGEVVDGQFRSLDPDGKPLVFGDRLREMLELTEAEAPIAQDLVKVLYGTEGDIYATAMKLITWSGFNQQIREAELAGN